MPKINYVLEVAALTLFAFVGILQIWIKIEASSKPIKNEKQEEMILVNRFLRKT